MNGRILQKSELDSIILQLPRVQDRGTLWIHEYEVQKKLTEAETTLRKAQQRIEELEAQVRSTPVVEAPVVDSSVVEAPVVDSSVVERIVAWLRSGPGSGATVRAKHAQKLASLIEAGAYDTGAVE